MSDQTTPAQPATIGAAGCCGPAPSTAAVPTDPCCGSARAAAEGGACCDPDAKADALAGGASCCGPAATSPAETADQTAPVPVPAERSAQDGLPVVVIGAGPVGLAAAAHLTERSLPFLVLEAGDTVAASVRQWGQVRLFSPWRYDIDQAARRLLDAAGWAAPDPGVLPTGADLVEDYLQPLAKLPAIAANLRLGARVVALARYGIDRIRTADRERYAGKHTIVVGAGHSAATTLIALAQLAEQTPGTRITWAVRAGNPDRAYGGGTDDALPARGALGTGLRMLVDTGRISIAPGFAVHTVRTPPGGDELVAHNADGTERVLAADRVVAATGYRPDHSIAAELRLALDPILGSTSTLAPLIDPNVHSCGTVRPHGVDELAHPEPNYWAVGVKSYGRAPTFLLATGYEQVRSIAAALAGDWQAARDGQLDLPETGVCSTTLGARDLLADATAQFGLPTDTPAKLIAAALTHLPAAGSTAEATRLAAAALGIDQGVAVQLAALAADRFDQPATSAEQVPTVGGRTQLVTVPERSGGCCG